MYGKKSNKHSPFIRLEIKSTSQTSKTALLFSNVRNTFPIEITKIDCKEINSQMNIIPLISQIFPILCSLISIKAMKKLKAKHCKIVYFIIINERNSKESLKFLLKKNSGLFGSVAQIIFVDSLINDYSRIWLTDYSRGFVQYNVKIPELEKDDYIYERVKILENSLVVKNNDIFKEVVNPINKDRVIIYPCLFEKSENCLIYKVECCIPPNVSSSEIYQKMKELISYLEINGGGEESGDLSIPIFDKIEDGFSGLKINPKLLEFINQTSKKYFNQNDLGIIQSPFTIFGIDELVSKYYNSDILIFGLSKIVNDSLEVNFKFCEKFICLFAEVIQQLNQYD